MKVSVLVCTHGDREWALRGAATAKSVTEPGYHEVIALHEANATLAEVRNLAATAASGEWLLFLDADDRLDGFYLSAMAEAEILLNMESAEYRDHLLVPSVSFVDQRGDPDNPAGCSAPTIPAWDRNIFDVNCAVIGTLVPRSLFARVGGFEEWSAYEDWALWLACIAAGAKLVPVPEAIYCAKAEDGTGRNTGANHRDTYDRIRAHYGHVQPAVWACAKLQ